MKSRTAIACAVSLLGATPSVAQNFDHLADVGVIMERGYKQDSTFVTGRGVHFALGEGVVNPIYCVNKNKVVCIEYTYTPEEFAAGFTATDLRGFEGLSPVDHMDIVFEPKGHGAHHLGAHYIIRLFFAPKSELAKMTTFP